MEVGSYHYVMWRGGDQIATEDGDREIPLYVSDEALRENCELDDEDADAIQEHQEAIRQWIRDQGFKSPIPKEYAEEFWQTKGR